MLRQTIKTTLLHFGQCTLCRGSILKPQYTPNLCDAIRPGSSITDHFKRKAALPMIPIDDDVGSALPLMGYPRKLFLLQILSRKLDCSPKFAKELLLSSIAIRKQTSVNISRLLNLLMVDNKIRSEVILNNTWILGGEYEFIKIKVDIMNKIVPKGGDINDFVPLLKTTVPRLSRYRKVAERDQSVIPGQHRIYYISNLLQIEPAALTARLISDDFILTMDFSIMDEIFKLQLNTNMKPGGIINNFKPFRNSVPFLRSRVKIFEEAGCKINSPWMLVCCKWELERKLKRTKLEHNLVGDKSVVEFVADRLGFDCAFTENMLSKFPVSYKLSATPFIKTIDFLLDEAGFKPHDIAQCPRILFHSLKTTKKRLDEWNRLDYVPRLLRYLCLSENEYQKFIRRNVAYSERQKSRKIKS